MQRSLRFKTCFRLKYRFYATHPIYIFLKIWNMYRIIYFRRCEQQAKIFSKIWTILFFDYVSYQKEKALYISMTNKYHKVFHAHVWLLHHIFFEDVNSYAKIFSRIWTAMQKYFRGYEQFCFSTMWFSRIWTYSQLTRIEYN